MDFNKLTPELLVSNLDRSKLFYVIQLGFTVEFERKEDRFIFISHEGSQLMLEEDHPDAWITGSLSFPRGRGINFQIEVSDLNTIIAKITEHNLSYFREPKEEWYRINDQEEGVRELLIQDPDGYLLRFQQYLGEREYRDHSQS
ncbi:bleomycin resistance protein [Chryseobacterium jejuense]|uniref:Bleomycin resistance protein n=1 Tax=Chryseobacterium jejuense TaxID=445960 RepID=A0A2X2X0N8_CHRJE|nr:VOC family protein [Chryseobacterium jejuense]SDJ52999.1 hypothetical protein SAMN05421542_3693 [Chryseobacterium jejuense]SQB46304.1 Glyoxalase-like domain [Chryseobacterium jejuense]